MPSLLPLLEKVAHDLEPEVRKRLGGFLGGMVRAYLPQVWEFRTEQEVAFLTVERSGSVSAGAGAAPKPDVTIRIGHDRLVAALTTRSRAKVPPGSVDVTAHTSKGRTAFDYLRGRLGL